jgi:GNAT superfamily N-acetyltransferase
MVEIGYTVDPAYRGRGYARAAFEALLLRAVRERQVRTAWVSISAAVAISRDLPAIFVTEHRWIPGGQVRVWFAAVLSAGHRGAAVGDGAAGLEFFTGERQVGIVTGPRPVTR